MDKRLKKIIIIIGVIFLSIVLITNCFYLSTITDSVDEKVSITFYGAIPLIVTLIICASIFIATNKLNSIDISDRKFKLCAYITLIIYFILQILWINYINFKPISDQEVIYNIANKMYCNENFTHSYLEQYLTKYPQQLNLAFIWNVIFRILHNSDYKIIQYINAISNCITMIMVLLITKQFSKKHKVNKWLCLFIFATFLTLPLLSTFVYGDEFGLALGFISIYFIIKYFNNKNKLKYLFCSIIFIALSIMLRMNMIIFFIAEVICLILDDLEKNKNNLLELDKIYNDSKLKKINSNNINIKVFLKTKFNKKYLIQILIILMFIIASLLPEIVLKKYFAIKNNINITDNKISVKEFAYMGISEGYKANRVV